MQQHAPHAAAILNQYVSFAYGSVAAYLGTIQVCNASAIHLAPRNDNRADVRGEKHDKLNTYLGGVRIDKGYATSILDL